MRLLANSTRWPWLRRLLLSSLICLGGSLPSMAQGPPNIVVILADDMGFSDLGCYGSEIQTAHLDSLAEDGLRFRRFYNTTKCSPTRASLLTGQYPHAAGMENLTTSGGGNSSAYLGYLSPETVTLAEVLGQAGYGSYLSGKWHVGENPGRWPLDRGFDRYWGLISGANSYYELLTQYGRQMALDNTPWNPATDYDATEQARHGRDGFYMTDATVDYALDFLGEHQTNRPADPFFLYLSFTAPHWPLHAYESDIDAYDGVYDAGWDSIRQARLDRMIQLGIMPPGTQLSSRDGSAWNSIAADDGDQDLDLDRGDRLRRMQTYAAQVERMDRAIGKLVQYLRSQGELDNTLILFMSDNGGSAEDVTGRNRHQSGTLVGEPGSYMSYLREWSNASNAPFRKHKNDIEEGGIATPLVAHWPDGITGSNQLTDQIAHVKDLMPTILQIANVSYPSSYNGNNLKPIAGESFAHIFANPQQVETRQIFWEYNGGRAARYGRWKAVSQSTNGSWALFDVVNDPTEQNNLASQYPDVVASLDTRYELWETSVGHQSGNLPDSGLAPTLAVALADQSVPEGVPFSFEVPSTAFADSPDDHLIFTASLSDGSALPSWLSLNGLSGRFTGNPSSGDLATPLSIAVTATDWAGNTVSDTFELTASVQAGPGGFALLEDFGYSLGALEAVSPWQPGGGNNGTVEAVAQAARLPFRAVNGQAAAVSATPGSAAYNYNPGTDGDNYFDQPINLPLNQPFFYAVDFRIADLSSLPDQSNIRSFIELSRDNDLNNTSTVRLRMFNNNGQLTVGVALGSGSNSPNDFAQATTADQGHQLVLRGRWNGSQIAFDAALDPGLDSAAVSWTSVGSQPASASTLELVRLFIGTGNTGGGSYTGLFTGIRISDRYTQVVVGGDNPPELTTLLLDQGPFAVDSALSVALADAFSDPEQGSDLAYQATLANGSPLPSWLNFDPATRSFNAAASTASPGSYDLLVSATDSSNQSVSGTFTLTLIPNANQTVLYQEVFGNDNPVLFNGNPEPLSPEADAGWRSFFGANAQKVTLSGREDPAPKVLLSGFDGRPDSLINLNAGPTLATEDGFLFANVTATPLLSFTDEYSLDLSALQGVSFSWYQGHGSAATTAPALLIDGQWYVSAQGESNPAVNGASNFASQAELKSLLFDPTASQWLTLAFDSVAGTLSLGAAPATDLPLGQLTAFGFYSDGALNSLRLDAFTIEGSPLSGNQPPVASLSGNPTSGQAPLPVGFDASGSSDDSGIASYQWDFGDGNSGSGLTVNHSYQTAGTFTAVLTVTDSAGLTDTAQATITVAPAPNFLAVPYRVNVGGGDYTKDGDLFAAEDLSYLIETQPTQVGTSSYSPYNVPGGHQPLYEPRRFGPDFSYEFPVVNGDYRVALHLIENFQSGSGLRVFDVAIEGNLVIDDLDLFAAYGKGSLTIQTFDATVSDNSLRIDFTGVINNAIVMAIELLPPDTVLSNENDILSFAVPGQIGLAAIDPVAHTVDALVGSGTALASLTPTITASSGASLDPASGVAQDFTQPVNYTVTAEDSSVQVWTVTVVANTAPDQDGDGVPDAIDLCPDRYNPEQLDFNQNGIGDACEDTPISFSPSSPRPNILWITCEDMSPQLASYGDATAPTPNLDQLAQEGVRYFQAFTNSGVCSPSRASIITGMHQNSIGAQNMRATQNSSNLANAEVTIGAYEAVPPADVKVFTEYLRAAGYFVTNDSKTDFQFDEPITAFNENGNGADWRDRPDPNQPFFSVINLFDTHESRVFNRIGQFGGIDPDSVPVPPYYPNTQLVREDIAVNYHNISRMDQQVGNILSRLENDGLLDNTIVFFFSDHGAGLPRAKRWIYESGTRVPFMVRFPDSSYAGAVTQELVSNVDLAPTMLSLAGLPIPSYMQGQAFLGDSEVVQDRAYVYAAKDRMIESYDYIRAVRNDRFRLIRNYDTTRAYIQPLAYRDQMNIMQELYALDNAGTADSIQALWLADSRPTYELYDMWRDPHEVHNLAGDSAYAAVFNQLKAALDTWMIETQGTATPDVSDLPAAEVALRNSGWPGGNQPSTATPAIAVDANGDIEIDCATTGASIVYKLDDEPYWQIYTEPLPLDSAVNVKARAIRLGYSESGEAEADLLPPGQNLPPDIQAQSFSVTLDAPLGQAIGTIVATDELGVVRYRILSGNGLGLVALDSASGQLTVADTSALDSNNSPIALSVEVADADSLTDTALVSILIEAAQPVEVAINFQDEPTVPPAGFLKDFGEGYGLKTAADQGGGSYTYGWKRQDNQQPQDLLTPSPGTGRNRLGSAYASATVQEQLYGTLVHAQGQDIGAWAGQARGVPVFWEIDLPNGTYWVEIGAGEISSGSGPEFNTFNVEGMTLIAAFDSKGPSNNVRDSLVVAVSDGALTISTEGGINSKLNYLRVRETSQSAVTPDTLSWTPNPLAITVPFNQTATESATLAATEILPSENGLIITPETDGGWLSLPVSLSTGANAFTVDAAGLALGATPSATVVATAKGFLPTELTVNASVVVPFQPVSIPYRANIGGAPVSVNGQSFGAEDSIYLEELAPDSTTQDDGAYGFTGLADDTVLYYPRRFGEHFAYRIPVPNGDYRVVVHMVENFFTAAGERVFDVSVEGSLWIDDLDLFDSLGFGVPYLDTLSLTVSDSVLDLELQASTNNAILMALEILPAALPVADELLGSVDIPAACGGDPLYLQWYAPGTGTLLRSDTTTLDSAGTFVVSDIVPGSYDLYVSSSGTLVKALLNQTLVAGNNAIAFGALVVGDINGDNYCTSLDFSLLAPAFNTALGDPAFDPGADFDCNGVVNATDFSLLSQAFNQAGDRP